MTRATLVVIVSLSAALAATAMACSAAERDLEQGDGGAGSDGSTEYPTTCADVRAANPSSGDGDYTLYVDNNSAKPWTAYCLDMAGEPKEYLTLAQTGPDLNFSQYTAGETAPGTDVRTNYTRIRIRPSDLLVDISDQTFSTSSGQIVHEFTNQAVITSVPYAVAVTCSQLMGLGNIDLRGTPFRVTSKFCTPSTPGGAILSAGDQVVDLTAQGACAWTAPDTSPLECLPNPYNNAGGFMLQLAYMP